MAQNMIESSSPEFNYSQSIQSRENSIKIEDIVNGFDINRLEKSSKKASVDDSAAFQSLEKLFTSSQQWNKAQERVPLNIKELKRNDSEVKCLFAAPESLPLQSNKKLERNQKVRISYHDPWKLNELNTNQDQGPQPIVWIQRLPCERRVIDYEQRLIYIPVQRIERCEYKIEHIVEFQKKQINQVKMSLEPREHVNYRLQYVPIQRKIIHLPQRLVSPDRKFLSTIRQDPEKQLKSYSSDGQLTFRQKNKYVTTSSYDFQSRAKEMMLIQEKMDLLKEKQKQLRPLQI